MQEKKRILVIEDDDSVSQLLLRALEFSYEVELIRDGIRAARRLDHEPVAHVMICDIMLPGMDGLQIARKAKTSKIWSQVPIIFLTAKTTPLDVIQGIQAGARHYLTKPFKLKDLLDKVAKIASP
jgi:DNA-binding response OmpR family regulator